MNSLTLPVPTWIVLASAAPFIGSFLGLLVARLPHNRPVTFGRSACDHCAHPLAARDLVPLLSWVALKGKCHYCGATIDALNFVIEIAAIGIVLWAASVTTGFVLVATCILGWTLLAFALIDWRHQLLPDKLTLPLVLAGLGAAYFIDRTFFVDHVMGAVIGFALLYGVARIYRYARGREGLGAGDAKLLAAIGAWVSWEGLPSVVFLGTLFGLLGLFILRLGGAEIRAGDRIPFGAYLATAAWLVWLYGPLGVS